MRPLVDIGVPTHGSPRFLTEALDSVMGQTFTGWRLRVSDNGGGNAEDLVRPYLADPRVSYSRNPENIGLTGNLSKLVRESEAPFVALLHDDDRWEPGFLERRVAFLQAHDDCGFVFSPVINIDEFGREIRRIRAIGAERVFTSREYVPKLLRDEDARPSPPTLVVRNSAYRAVGPDFDPRFTVTDLEMWLRLALQFPVGYLPVWDASYRFHGGQTSSWILWGDSWLAFQEHAEALLDKHLPEAQYTPRERRVRRASAYLSIALDRAGAGEPRRALRALRRAVTTHPRAVVDTRLIATLIVTLLEAVAGERARRGVQRLRYALNRRGIRSPFHLPH